MSGLGCSGLPWQLSALMLKPLSESFCLNVVQLGLVLEHRKLAMRIARIVSGAQLDGADVQALELLQYVVQGKLRQQGGEYADSHVDVSFARLGSGDVSGPEYHGRARGTKIGRMNPHS